MEGLGEKKTIIRMYCIELKQKKGKSKIKRREKNGIK